MQNSGYGIGVCWKGPKGERMEQVRIARQPRGGQSAWFDGMRYEGLAMRGGKKGLGVQGAINVWRVSKYGLCKGSEQPSLFRFENMTTIYV